MKDAIKGIAGLLLLILASLCFTKHVLDIIAGVIGITAGVLCFPPVFPRIEKMLGASIKTPVKYALVVGLAVTGFVICRSTAYKEPDRITDTDNGGTTRKADTAIGGATVASGDSIKIWLHMQLDSFDMEPLNTGLFRGTLAKLSMEPAFFDLWIEDIDTGLNDPDPEAKKLASQLKGKVSDLQKKEFPEMRKEYGDITARAMLAYNTLITTGGPGNTILNITNVQFDQPKMVADMEDEIHKDVTRYRFKEVRYRWQKDQADYTAYNLDVPDDGTVVKITSEALGIK